jgi:hypothetical protein
MVVSRELPVIRTDVRNLLNSLHRTGVDLLESMHAMRKETQLSQ